MENDLIANTAGYLLAPIALLAAIGFALCHVATRRRVPARSATGRLWCDTRRANAVFDDRC